MADSRTVVEVKTVDGEVYRHWNDDWKIADGVLTVLDGGRYYVYAAGQWISAKDVNPQ